MGKKLVLIFLKTNKWDNQFDCIFTNPPYRYAVEITEKAIKTVKNNGLAIMFMKLTFLESAKRYNFFKKISTKICICICKQARLR